MASAQPHRFRRLVIAGVGANAFRPEAGDGVSSALLEGIPPDAPQALRTVVEEALASGNDPRALSAVIRRPPHPLCTRQLSRVLAEVLLVVGSEDAIAGAPEPLAQAIPTVHTMVIDGLDHAATPSADEFASAAAIFIAAER